MRIDIFLHEGDTATRAELADIKRMLAVIINKEVKMAGELDQLATDVAKNADVEASAAQTLDQIKALLDAAGTDPAKLAALSTQLGTSRDALAAAIARDTPPTP